MFDLSFGEIILAVVVALIVLGPARLHSVARQVGVWVGKWQRMSANIKAEWSAHTDFAELSKIKHEIENTAQEIRNEIKDLEQHWHSESQKIKDTLPAWERLPEQRTIADFQGDSEHAIMDNIAPRLTRFYTPSLRKQSFARKRDLRPRHRPRPKLRIRK